jgi:hypothetical protein
MKNNLSSRDWELLSSYIDGQLSNGKRAQLEARLQVNPDLRAALDDLTRTRAMLRSLPRVKVPRSFKLTPEMVGQREPRRLYPFFQLASALTSVMLVLVLLTDFLGFSIQAPLGGMASQAPEPMASETFMEDVPPGILADEYSENRKSLPQEPTQLAEEAQVEGLMVLGTPLPEEPAAEPAAEAELYLAAPAVPQGEAAPELTNGGAGALSEPVHPEEPPAPLPESAFREVEPESDTIITESERVSTNGLSSMRVLQISLAFVAASTALVAFYLRRVGG